MTNKINNYIFYLLIIFSVYCALIIGLSLDELAHISRGNERLKYLLSLGAYDYIDYRDQRFYPGFYNTFLVLVTKFFPKKFEIEILHLTNLFFSIFTIFGISKIAKELFNEKIGKIVFLIAFVNPIFFGHMAINQKDTIIAFSNIWSTYLIIKYLKNQHIKEKVNKYIVLAGLVIGVGLGTRVIFISTLIPFILIVLFDLFFSKKMIKNNFSKKKFLFDCVKVLIISYIIMISCWPDTHQNIFLLPFDLFFESLKHPFGVSYGLLNGTFYYTDSAPKNYLILNLFYKLPEYIILGSIFSIILIIRNKDFFVKKFNFFYMKIIFIFLIILFPNILLLFSPYRVYDGLRLFLYLIPFICLIPSLTIYFFIENYKNIFSKIGLTIISILFLYNMFIFVILTPYQYTYINTLNGNFSNASKKFENDYWGASLKELTIKIKKEKILLNQNSLKLAFCGVSHNTLKKYLNEIEDFNFDYSDYRNENFDYVIMTNRIDETVDNVNLSNVKTCFEKFSGKDIVSVKRNGLVLSSLRKIN